jgi:site-specific DNA-cytosine methylase
VADFTQTYVSLFAGCGGLDLAVQLVVPEARCIGYVEIEVPAVGILAARMEDGSMDEAPVWSDIRSFPAELYRGRVAGAVFGFPCQDLSVAGKQAGLAEGTRSGLFYDAMRTVRSLGCEWVFLENVPPVLAFPAGYAVLRELAESGFDAEWISVRAADVEAPHRRERVFILAYRSRRGLGVLRESSERFGLVGGAVKVWSSPVAADGAETWKTPHGMGGMDASGKHGGSGGGEFAKQATNWTTPQAHDSGGGNPDRVRRKGTEHGCANLADDVTKWAMDE